MSQNEQSNPSSETIRVLLCDHHACFRDGLSQIINATEGMRVVGEAGDLNSAVSSAKENHPDIILLELNLGGVLDLEVIPHLLKASPKSRIILLTGLREMQIHHKAIELGAMGIILKEERAKVVIKAIQKVSSGEVWIDRMMMAEFIAKMAHGASSEVQDYEATNIAQLTEREREVIQLIGKGYKNKQIAEELSISEITVRHHLTSIYSKLNVSDRLELIIFAYRNHLAELPD